MRAGARVQVALVSQYFPIFSCLFAHNWLQVDCKCGWSFCFSCGEEAHRPLGCNLLKKSPAEQPLLTRSKER